jgi:hypothetical protein
LSTSIHAFDAPEARESSSKEFVETTWEYPRRGRGEGGRSGDDRPAVPWRWDVADEADLVQVGLRDAPEARESSSKEFVETTWEYPREDVEAWLKQVEYPKVSNHAG